MFLQLCLLIFTSLCLDFAINHQNLLSYDILGQSCDIIPTKRNYTRKIIHTTSGARINYECDKTNRWFPKSNDKCILNVKRKTSNTKRRYLKFDLLSILPQTKKESSPKLWEMYGNNCSTRNGKFVLCACNSINKFVNNLPKLKDKWSALRVLNRFAKAMIEQLKEKRVSGIDEKCNNCAKESAHKHVVQSITKEMNIELNNRGSTTTTSQCVSILIRAQ